MAFNILAVRNGDDVDGGVWPLMAAEPGGMIVRQEHLDRGNISVLPVKHVTVSQLFPDKTKRILELLNLEGSFLYITDGRVVFASTEYARGGGWSGVGAGMGIAVIANSVSKARAKARSRGTILAGHIRYQWLTRVGASPKAGPLSFEEIRLGYSTKSEGAWRLYVLDIAFPHAGTAIPAAEEITRRAAAFKLAHYELPDEGKAGCRQLVDAPGLVPPQKGKYASHVFPWFLPVRKDNAYPADPTLAGQQEPPPPGGARLPAQSPRDSSLRDLLLDDVRARVTAARDNGDFAPVMSPAGTDAAERLLRSVPDPASELEVAWAAGWLHWLRFTQLGEVAGDRDLALATKLLSKVHTQSAGDVPLLIRQAHYAHGKRPDTPPADDRAGEWDNRGLELYQEYERTRDLTTLRVAAHLIRKAVDGTPPGNPDRAGYLSNLLGVQQAIFEHTGDINALIEAVQSGREALTCMDSRHPSRPLFLTNIGGVLRSLSEQTSDLDALHQAIALGREAVASAARDDPQRAFYHSVLAQSLETLSLFQPG